MSRQPVIQALRILSEQGILVPHGKKGLTVATLNEKNLLKLLDVRKQLDCLGVRLAAQRVKDSSLIDEDHEIIEAINRLIFDSHLLIVNGEHLKLVRSDISFHKLLRALSGNEFIQSVLEPHLSAPQQIGQCNEYKSAYQNMASAQRNLGCHFTREWETG